VAAAVGVERAEQPVGQDDFLDALEAAGGTLLVGEEQAVVLRGGIVHGVDQIPHLAGTHSWVLPS